METPQQHLKRFKAELVPLESGPYSDIYITLSKALHHGSNTYSILSTADQDIVYEALRQRCHSSQLRSHKYVLLCNNSRGIRLPPGLTLQDFLPSRPRSNSTPKRRAVAIDREMVGIEVSTAARKNNRTTNGGLGKLASRRIETSEIAYICAVDFLTGEILINQFVQPRGKIINWRTKHSGITSRALWEASLAGTALRADALLGPSYGSMLMLILF